MNTSFGNATFSIAGLGVNSSGNSTVSGANQQFATPLVLKANEDYRFTTTGATPSLEGYRIQNLIFELLMDEATGRVNGTAAQLGFQNTSSAFQVLSRQLKQVSRAQQFASPLQPMALRQMESVNPIALVGYETDGAEANTLTSTRQSCCCSSIQNEWNGWVSGYGIGGDVQSDGAFAGLSYRSGGTQFGVYRNLDRNTLVGMFGGYSNQSVDGDDGDTADIESGQFGAFLNRQFADNAYLMAAGSGAFDSYRTRTSTGASADFDGAQAATYLELGRQGRWGRSRWNPSLALQYVYLHQEGHTEVGTVTPTIDSVNEHSLRSILGGTAQGAARKVRTGQITPYASLHWMHEFLDTTTNVTGMSGGTGFATNGVSLGRDWALVGGGASYSVNSYSNLYAGYDLQVNDRQTFHTGNGGVQFAW
ncbi:autotransporter outer membrane beta-barrel domain-containing protein [Stieleria marina]